MENSTYKHHYEFRMRPYDDKWCIVTRDNKCHDITVAVDLDEPIAEWMCKALNLGLQIEKLSGLDAWNARAGSGVDAEAIIKARYTLHDIEHFAENLQDDTGICPLCGSGPGHDDKCRIFGIRAARAALIEHVTGKGER